MKKYTAKQLTKYAEKIGFNEPRVWYTKMDGWWLETDKTEEYLGVWSSEARNKLTELSEGIYSKKKIDEVGVTIKSIKNSSKPSILRGQDLKGRSAGLALSFVFAETGGKAEYVMDGDFVRTLLDEILYIGTKHIIK